MTPVRGRIMKPLLLQYGNRSFDNNEEAHELRDQVERLVWFQTKLSVWNEMVRKYER